MKFESVFEVKKPIIGMLHLKGNTEEEVLERAIKEIKDYITGGIDGIMVENYYGNYYDMERVLNYLQENPISIPVGLNCLKNDTLAFELASRFKVKFIQIDSVIGHLKERDDISLAAFLNLYRSKVDICLFGGVRFKYVPLLSAKSLKEDLDISKDRCDAICVTEDATGQETSMEKIIEFRNNIGDFPLIVAAGATVNNITKQLKYCDGAVVGSTFKDNRKDNGDICVDHIKEFMAEVMNFRKENYD